MKITKIEAHEILDSRGNPTLKTTVVLEDGSTGWAAVPSGASTGKYEAHELRDKDEKRYLGMGVLKAIDNVHGDIAKVIAGIDAEDQKTLDLKMIETDGTQDKSKLGANAILSVSLSAARAQSTYEKKSLFEHLSKYNPHFDGHYILPIPQMNIMNGGRHANWAVDIQEYMILPVGAKNVTDAIRMCSEIFHVLQNILKEEGLATTAGDEGGYAPNLDTNEAPLHFISQAVERAGYVLGKDIYLGMDAAASELKSDGGYWLRKEEKSYSSTELAVIYDQFKSKYPIISMEDIFDQDDWESFKNYTEKNGNLLQIVGDDLYTTNVLRIKKGIETKATNAVLIKPNQIGTLTETIEAILLAKDNNLSAIISHRSGETEDPFIADLAVAMGCSQIKTGAPCRSERTVKYNRLMHIERKVGDKGTYASFPFHPQ